MGAVSFGCRPGYTALSFLLTFLLSPQDTYYLSAEECITAGHFQNQQPNICRLSPDGHFGSKFVTVVATGTNWPRLVRALSVTRELSLVNSRICSSVRSQTSWSPSVLFNKGSASLCQVKYFFMFLCYLLDNYLPCPLQESYLRLRAGAPVSVIHKAFFARSQGNNCCSLCCFKSRSPSFCWLKAAAQNPVLTLLWLLQRRAGTFISLVSPSGQPLPRMLCPSMHGNLLFA